MWSLLRTLLVQGILAKTALRSFGWLAWLLPLGFLLKWIGLPILLVLGTLALPVLILLAIVGLPLIVVLFFGGVLISIVGFVLAAGFALAKVLIPLALIFLLLRWIWRSRRTAPLTGPVTGSTS